MKAPRHPCEICGCSITDAGKDKHRDGRLCQALVRTRRLERSGYVRCKSSARPIQCAGVVVERGPTVYTSPDTPTVYCYHVIEVPWAPCWAVLVAESCGRLPYPEYKRNKYRRVLLVDAAYDESWRTTLEAIYKLGGDQKAVDQIVHKAVQRILFK
jgi:hypothetical protein